MYDIKYFKRLRLNLGFFILLFLILLTVLNLPLFAGKNDITLSDLNAKDLIVLTSRKGCEDFNKQLGKYLGNIGTAKCLERKNRIDAVKTPAQFEEFRKERLASFLTGIGPFPERTPLNVKHYGRIDCGDYIIDKLTFESRPGYIVTASLYIPTKHTPPWPIVLCPIGHWEANRGKDYFLVQERGIGLARRGYLTMIFEPFGQGERRIYYDPSLELKGKLGYATNQHAYLNYQLHLTGHNMANFFAWDGIRALDYLCSRDDVNVSRIAVTGASGGGTQTQLFSAVDSRIKAAVPVCANSYRGSDYQPGLGNPDGEQNVPGMYRYAIEHLDKLIMNQVKDVLIMNASGDRGSIVSSVDMFNEMESLFKRAAPEHSVSYHLIGAPHSYNRDFRETLYTWLNRCFDKKEEGSVEAPISLKTTEELNITRSGNIEELGSETPLTLNIKYADEIAPEPATISSKEELNSFKNNLRRKIQNVLKMKKVQDTPILWKNIENLKGKDFTMEKVAFSSEEDIWLPGLMITPKEYQGSSVILYIHERGKANGLENIKSLVRSGLKVFAVDTRGFKETLDPHPGLEKPARKYKLLYSDDDAKYNAYCYGLEQPLFGMRLLDIMAAIKFLREMPDVNPDNVSIYGYGDGAMLALHAAVLDNKIKIIGLNRLLLSFRSLAVEPFWSHSPFLFIHNVLANYDVPDLLAALGGRQAVLANTVGTMRQVLEKKEVQKAYDFPLNVFRILEVEKKLWLGNISDIDFAQRFSEIVN